MALNPTDATATLPASATPPDCLADFTPTRTRRHLLPFGSRVPVTGRLGEVWHHAAQRNPGGKVVADRAPDVAPECGAELSYGSCAQLVDQLSARLHAAGVRAGDRVAVVKRNHLDVGLLASAVARLGAVPALFSDNHDRGVLQTLLRRLQEPFLITDAQTVARIGIDAELVALTRRTITVDDMPHRLDLDGLAAFPASTAPPVTLRDPDQPQVIAHTSGTTGLPKLVMHSAASLYALALVEAERWPVFGLRTDDTFLFCEPYCHQRVITGLLTMATVTPTLICLSDPADPGVRAALIRHRPTFVETLPNGFLHWEPLTADPARPFARVRVYINSFDGIHTRTVRAFLGATDRRFPLWVQSWSQTEAGAIAVRPYTRATVRRVGRRPPPTQVLGWPVPGFGKLRAVDPVTGQPVRSGQVGRIQISAPGRCLGYLAEQDRYRRKIDGRWWDLGDLGVINRAGVVRLVDREIDHIPGGSALELEDVLLDRLPHTTEIIVLAVRDGLPQPVLSVADDAPLDAGTWAAAAADLPALAEPIQIGWDQFPRTATWKVKRTDLRRQLLGDAAGFGTGSWT